MTTSGARYCGVPTIEVSIVPALAMESACAERLPPTHFCQTKVGNFDPFLHVAWKGSEQNVLSMSSTLLMSSWRPTSGLRSRCAIPLACYNQLLSLVHTYGIAHGIADLIGHVRRLGFGCVISTLTAFEKLTQSHTGIIHDIIQQVTSFDEFQYQADVLRVLVVLYQAAYIFLPLMRLDAENPHVRVLHR